MATVTGLTAARMLAIEAASVVSGAIVGNDLILTKFDASTINAGNVRGPIGPNGADGAPVGTIIMGGWAAEPSNYKFLNGQTITGGVATYPTIATMYPSWVSGGNLILPNAMAGAVPMGASASLGTVSGSMTHTLVEGNLASHVHAGPSHTHTGPSHTHTFTTGIESAGHTHAAWNNGTSEFLYRTAGGSQAITVTTTGYTLAWATGTSFTTTTQSANHTHSGTSDAGGTGNTGASGTGNTAAAGSGLPVDHTPKNITVKFAVKMV